METTIHSLVDATSLLRVGGMISIITYPTSGPDEDAAVRLFVTCLGLLSSKTRTWEEAVSSFLASAPPPAIDDGGRGGDDATMPAEIRTTEDCDNDDALALASASATASRELIAQHVTRAMEMVVERVGGNQKKQTWRVSQHDNLGMDRPPVLFTVTRLK